MKHDAGAMEAWYLNLRPGLVSVVLLFFPSLLIMSLNKMS